MPLLLVFVVYVPTYARYWRVAEAFSEVCAEEKSSGAASTIRNAIHRRLIFMRRRILSPSMHAAPHWQRLTSCLLRFLPARLRRRQRNHRHLAAAGARPASNGPPRGSRSRERG